MVILLLTFWIYNKEARNTLNLTASFCYFEKQFSSSHRNRAEDLRQSYKAESYTDVADSRTERVGNRRGERTGEGVQHRVQHSTPPTLVSMATTTLERVIMQFSLSSYSENCSIGTICSVQYVGDKAFSVLLFHMIRGNVLRQSHGS